MPPTPSREEIEVVLTEMLDEGNKALLASEWGLKGHCETLTTAMLRAAQDAGVEIRLTYKSAEEAAAAWTWALSAAKKAKIYDLDKSKMFDIELKNGSGIVFGLDEADSG